MTADLLDLFRERGALLEGHFLLSSGLHSPRYLQSARVLMDPPLATRLGEQLAALVRPDLGGRAVTAAVSPSSLPQSSTGRLEVSIVLTRS